MSILARLIYFELDMKDILRDTEFTFSKVEGSKNNAVAKIEFDKAKDFLKDKNYRKAIESVNYAICLSTDYFTNECFLLRADILFKANLFDDCRSNLALIVGELTKKNNIILEHMHLKLNKYFEENQLMLPKPLNPTQQEIIVPKFHCEPHPIIPFIDKCLELDYDDYGVMSGVRCNSDLKAGDILVIEDQLCPILFNDKRYIRCDNCLIDDKCSVLISCNKCTVAMFCNNDCMEKAWESYHKYECPIIKMLSIMHPLRTVHRLLVTGFKTSDDIDDFINFTNEPQCTVWNAFKIDWSNPPRNYLQKIIYTMSTGDSTIPTSQKLLFTRLTAFFINLVRLNTTLVKDRFNTPNRLNFLRELSYRYVLICSNNLYLHQINNVYRFPNENHKFSKTILALRMFQSFFKYSCKNNVASSSYGLNKSIVFTRRPVKRGDRLIIDFLQDLPQRIRKDVLIAELNHSCNCFSNDCNIKFPCETSTHISDDKSLDFLLKEMDKLYLLHTENVVQLLNLANEYLTDHEHEYPSYELYIHYNAVVLCLHRLYGLPILHDVGTELYYELYYLQWARSCEMLKKIVNLYRQSYGNRNIRNIRLKIFEYLAKSLPVKNDVFKLPSTFETLTSFELRYERPIINSTFPIIQKLVDLDMVLPTMRYQKGITFKPVDDDEARAFLKTNYLEIGLEFDANVMEMKKKPLYKNKFKRRQN